MTLDSFFENHSMHKMNNGVEDLLNWVNISNLKIWQPVKELQQNFNYTLSKKLKDIKNIDMITFLSDLNDADTDIHYDNHVAIWPFILAGVGLLVLLSTIGFMIFKRKCFKPKPNYAIKYEKNTTKEPFTNDDQTIKLQPSAPSDQQPIFNTGQRQLTLSYR